LQNQDVGDCLRPYSSVIATAAYVCLEKKEKLTEPVYDCNNLATVIATRSYVCCKKWKPDFVCLLLDCLNMIANLGSK
jgi:hypothetical protein